MDNNILKKYAELIVRMGVNVQRGEEIFLNAPIDGVELTRAVVKEAYEAGAKHVTVSWKDDVTNKLRYVFEDETSLTDVPRWLVEQKEEILSRKGVNINLISADPKLYADIPPQKLAAYSRALSRAVKKFSDSTMSNETRWTIAGCPTPAWAKAVFPDLPAGEGVEKLWGLIIKTMRLDSADPIKAWQEHQENINRRKEFLNKADIETLHYVSSLGTDFTIGLPKGYIFEGGGSLGAKDGINFIANMPTEEVFSAPDKRVAEGVVCASIPLIYNGNMIENIKLTFKDGRVTEFDAGAGKEVLQQLIETDEGTHHLGEVAFVGYNSPIQNLKALFYCTLYDENASCHFALGRAYPTCLKDSDRMSAEQRDQAGLNTSLEHVDFMVGTKDLSIKAKTRGGKEIDIFKDGDWAI